MRISTMNLAACVAASLVSLACSRPTPQTASRTTTTSASASETNKTKCGACHAPFDPGERTRAELDPILAKHHDRVALSDPEWQDLAAYLAKK